MIYFTCNMEKCYRKVVTRMKTSRVGGIIAAASKKDAFPMLQIGQIPIVKRIVLTFQQAGIFPIVIITGAEEDEVKSQLSDYGVIFLQNTNSEAPFLFESVKIGLSYLQDKCDRVAFAPVNVPMFTPETLKLLINTDYEIVTPTYRQTGGHPVLLSSGVIPEILAYTGENGLRGAVASMESRRKRVEVDDEGVVSSVWNPDRLNSYLNSHNKSILHPFMRISIEKETLFFNSRMKLLLLLIADTHSVRSACDLMALSYAKAWDMLNTLETELGYPVLIRRQGGSHGGKTDLNEKGFAFLEAYQQFEDNIFRYTQGEFNRLFRETNIL